MKKQRDIFGEIEHVMSRLTFVIVSGLGFVVFVMMAVKHVIDYWKTLF